MDLEACGRVFAQLVDKPLDFSLSEWNENTAADFEWFFQLVNKGSR
jgi:hypothetical protein